MDPRAICPSINFFGSRCELPIDHAGFCRSGGRWSSEWPKGHGIRRAEEIAAEAQDGE